VVVEKKCGCGCGKEVWLWLWKRSVVVSYPLTMLSFYENVWDNESLSLRGKYGTLTIDPKNEYKYYVGSCFLHLLVGF